MFCFTKKELRKFSDLDWNPSSKLAKEIDKAIYVGGSSLSP